MMRYKGYIGRIEYDSEARLFHGEIIGLKDVITFQGRSAEELELAFQESIDDYLAWCRERGEKPEKGASGLVQVKMDADLHAYLAFEAARQEISLNELINEKLRK